MNITERSLAGQNVIAFRFAIGQRVFMPDAGCHGRIKQMCASIGGREYYVAYFDGDNVRRTEWLGEDEIEVANA